MGANWFTESYDDPDAAAAFAAAREQAGHTYGHGYSGSLSEKRAFRVLTADVLGYRDALAYARAASDDPRIDDKWGPAGAVAYTRDDAGQPPRKVRTTVAFTAAELGGGHTYEQAIAAITDKVAAAARPGERVVNVGLVSTGADYKVSQRATQGRTLTRYILEGVPGADTWATGFDTQAAARRAADTWLNTAEQHAWEMPRDSQIAVSSVTRRASGEPLVVATRTLRSAAYTVDVEYAPAVTSGRVDGWLFFGYASS